MWKHAVVGMSLTLVGLAFGVSEVEACSCVIGSGAPAGLSREEQSGHYQKSYREHVRERGQTRPDRVGRGRGLADDEEAEREDRRFANHCSFD